MSQSNVPDWLSWVVPVIAAGGVLWSFARRLFVSVTREELLAILEKAEEERHQRETEREARRQSMHGENLEKFDELFERLGHVEKDVSFLRGQRSGR